MSISTMDCLFCLNQGSLELKRDKRGRPFLRCWSCGVMAFIKTERSFVGLKLFGNLIPQMMQEHGNNYNAMAAQAKAQYMETSNASTG